MCACLQDSARKIARVAIEAKLELDEEKYVESFRPHLMDVVHAWSSVSLIHLSQPTELLGYDLAVLKDQSIIC